MKLILVVLGLAFAVSPACADDNLLANGDFSKGMQGWSGDFRALTNEDKTFTGSVDLSKGSSGAIIDFAQSPLTPGKYWFTISQSFKSSAPTLNYKITYQVSDDYEPKDWVPNPDPLDTLNPRLTITSILKVLGELRGGSFTSEIPVLNGPDFALVVFNKTNGDVVTNLIQPSLGSTTMQTASGSMNNPSGADEMTFVLVFKAGTGKVALFNVSLTASNVPAATAPLLDKSSIIPQLNL